MKTVAIIGGGFSGTMVLYHLMADHDASPMRVLFFDDAKRHARGVAYSTPVDEHLLNVPAGGMTGIPGDMAHFVAWLDGQVGRGEPGVFYPRRLYGQYIQQFFETAQDMARKNGHDIQIINDHVETITKTESGALAIGEHRVDAVVLATGASQPRWPGSNPMPNDDRLIANPYGPTFPDALERIKNYNRVAILGTGLSGADAVMSLHRSGYTGKIICVSRHNNWPVKHGLKKPWDWRRIIDSLRPHSNKIWRGMPQNLRAFCLRHIGYWNVVRHRMPRQCHAVLHDLKKTGQLQMARGSIRDIIAHDNTIDVVLDTKTVEVDAVINCLGFIGAGVMGNPLYKGLNDAGMIRVQDGLLNPDDFKLSDDYPIYVLGPPLFGFLIETSAVPELRVQAKTVAGKITNLFAA